MRSQANFLLKDATGFGGVLGQRGPKVRSVRTGYCFRRKRPLVELDNRG